jgi:hypothetical protein
MEDHKKVWSVLQPIDCAEQIEKKGNMKYLSWPWAWAIAMEHFPDTSFEVKYFADPSHETKQYPFEIHPDGTATVWMEITINGIRRTMWLPVMDNRNNSIKNPSSRQVSDTTMRCLVKGLALFGLGHYIYAGEDVPEAPTNEPEPTPDRAKIKPFTRQDSDSKPAVIVQLEARFGSNEGKVTNHYLKFKGGKYLKKGQTWRDLPSDILDKVAKNLEGFCKSINL